MTATSDTTTAAAAADALADTEVASHTDSEGGG